MSLMSLVFQQHHIYAQNMHFSSGYGIDSTLRHEEVYNSGNMLPVTYTVKIKLNFYGFREKNGYEYFLIGKIKVMVR